MLALQLQLPRKNIFALSSKNGGRRAWTCSRMALDKKHFRGPEGNQGTTNHYATQYVFLHNEWPYQVTRGFFLFFNNALTSHFQDITNPATIYTSRKNCTCRPSETHGTHLIRTTCGWVHRDEVPHRQNTVTFE